MKRIIVLFLLLLSFSVRGQILCNGWQYASTGGPPSTNLWAYFESDNSATVSQWSDLSGNARHLTQSTVGSRPLLVGGEYTFNGVTPTFMTLTGTLTQQFTIYMVVKWTPVNTAYFLKDGGGAGTNIIVAGASTEIYVSGNGFSTALSSATAPPSNTYFLLRAVYNGASSVSQVNSATAGTGTVTGNSTGTIAVGTSSGSIFQDNFNIKGLYIYQGAVTDATFKAYITTKWGISGLFIPAWLLFAFTPVRLKKKKVISMQCLNHSKAA